jgi:hypothetical protein
MIGVIAKYLYPRGAGRQKLLHLVLQAGVARGNGDEEAGDGLVLDVIDAAMNEAEGMR